MPEEECPIACEVARSGGLEPGCFTKYQVARMGVCARGGVLKFGRVFKSRDPSPQSEASKNGSLFIS